MHVKRPATPRGPDSGELPTMAALVRIELEPVHVELGGARRAADRRAASLLKRYLADLVIAVAAAVLIAAVGRVRRRPPAGGRA
jgi:hypothetical protein